MKHDDETSVIEARAKRELADRVRAVLRLISPEHITPMGKRQIERVLDEETAAVRPIRDLARPHVGLTPAVRSKALAIFHRFGATDVRIFGSVAKGTDQPGSDIDFVAKFPEGFSLFDLVALEDELGDLLGVRVDVVSDHPRGGRGLAEIKRTAVPLSP